MAEKSSILYGEEPSPKEIEELEKLKVSIVEQLKAADVKFPIRNKGHLESIYPKGTRKSCMYRGREVSIHDMIPLLEDKDFPINSAGDAAAALLSKCDLGR